MRLRQRTAGTKPQARSKITNGKKLFEHVPTRIRSERRFRDLLEAYNEQFEIANEADRTLVRNAATLTFEQEEMAAAKMRGERVDGDDVVRISSELRRVLGDLKRKAAQQSPAPPSLHDHLFSTLDACDDDEEANE